MTGACAAALSLTAFGHPCSPDDIIRGSGLSIDHLLKHQMSAADIKAMMDAYRGDCTTVPVPTQSAEALSRFLLKNTSLDSIVLMHLDFNIVHGFPIKAYDDPDSHGPIEWYIVASVAPELAIVDTHSISATRIWTCSIHQLLYAVQASPETCIVRVRR